MGTCETIVIDNNHITEWMRGGTKTIFFSAKCMSHGLMSSIKWRRLKRRQIKIYLYVTDHQTIVRPQPRKPRSIQTVASNKHTNGTVRTAYMFRMWIVKKGSPQCCLCVMCVHSFTQCSHNLCAVCPAWRLTFHHFNGIACNNPFWMELNKFNWMWWRTIYTMQLCYMDICIYEKKKEECMDCSRRVPNAKTFSFVHQIHRTYFIELEMCVCVSCTVCNVQRVRGIEEATVDDLVWVCVCDILLIYFFLFGLFVLAYTILTQFKC